MRISPKSEPPPQRPQCRPANEKVQTVRQGDGGRLIPMFFSLLRRAMAYFNAKEHAGREEEAPGARVSRQFRNLKVEEEMMFLSAKTAPSVTRSTSVSALHWPEYAIEGAGLALFMISACI